MTKQEFLTDLQRALTNKINATEVNAHVNYYSEYIETEVRKGRKEEEVTSELGSPRLIAKSILSAAAMDQKTDNHMEDAGTHETNTNSKWIERLRELPGWLWVLIVIFIMTVSTLSLLLCAVAIFVHPSCFEISSKKSYLAFLPASSVDIPFKAVSDLIISFN